MNILLVDDTELFLDLEKSYLERESFNISMARSGQEALDSIRTSRPDVVILDLIMPGMDGDAVCREIKSNPATRSIPVIMVSSAGKPGLKDRCFASGCDAFVPKPLRRDDLLRAIEKVLVIAKRTYPRVPTHLPSYIQYKGRDLEAWIHTISVGGLFLEMSPTPEPGEEMGVAFSLPETVEPIRARAQARWRGRVRTGGPSGVGVQFLDLSEEDREVVGKYVEAKLSAVGSLKGFA